SFCPYIGLCFYGSDITFFSRTVSAGDTTICIDSDGSYTIVNRRQFIFLSSCPVVKTAVGSVCKEAPWKRYRQAWTRGYYSRRFSKWHAALRPCVYGAVCFHYAAFGCPGCRYALFLRCWHSTDAGRYFPVKK